MRSPLALRAGALMAAAVLAGCGRTVPANRPIATDAWIRPTPPMVTVGAAYATLRAGRDDRLLAIAVPDTIAGHTELHESTRDAAGRMGMREVEGLALPAGRMVKLEPGGAHLMLLDLRRPLVAGDRVPLAFRFARAAPETLVVEVGGR